MTFGQFVSPWTTEGQDKFWDSVFDTDLGPYDQGVPIDPRGRLSCHVSPDVSLHPLPPLQERVMSRFSTEDAYHYT